MRIRFISLLLAIFISVTIFFGSPVMSQDLLGVTQKTIDGISTIAGSIVSDSFVPMTHYKEGEWTGTFVPAYFKITRAYDDPQLKGSGLDGFAFGFGGGYALTDRFMAYGILSYMGIDGDISPAEGDYQNYKVKTEYSLLNVNAGLGFDFLTGGKWSAPVFVGFGMQYFDLSLDFPTILSSDAYATGSEVIGTFNLSIAASRMFFNYIKVTPYYLFMVGFNRPSIQVSATSGGIPTPAQSVKMDTIVAGMLGLSISFVPTKALSVSISIGGLLTSSSQFYNRLFLSGTEMLSLVMAVTYRGGVSPAPGIESAEEKNMEYY